MLSCVTCIAGWLLGRDGQTQGCLCFCQSRLTAFLPRLIKVIWDSGLCMDNKNSFNAVS